MREYTAYTVPVKQMTKGDFVKSHFLGEMEVVEVGGRVTKLRKEGQKREFTIGSNTAIYKEVKK